jgi:hypothetical protein
MLWNDFIRLNHVYKLPLNEQLRRFKEHIIHEEQQIAGQRALTNSVPTFNFTFNQQNETGGTTTISSISGFTSTPAFTSTAGLFTFSPKGSPAGLITFSFVASSNGGSTLSADLSVNEGLPEQLVNSIGGPPTTFTFTRVNVPQNATVVIRTYDDF